MSSLPSSPIPAIHPPVIMAPESARVPPIVPERRRPRANSQSQVEISVSDLPHDDGNDRVRDQVRDQVHIIDNMILVEKTEKDKIIADTAQGNTNDPLTTAAHLTHENITDLPFPHIWRKNLLIIILCIFETTMGVLLGWAALGELNSRTLILALCIKLIVFTAMAIAYWVGDHTISYDVANRYEKTSNVRDVRMKGLVHHSGIISRCKTIVTVLNGEVILTLFMGMFTVAVQGEILNHLSTLPHDLLALWIFLIIVGGFTVIALGVINYSLDYSQWKTGQMIDTYFTEDHNKKVAAYEKLQADHSQLLEQRIARVQRARLSQ